MATIVEKDSSSHKKSFLNSNVSKTNSCTDLPVERSPIPPPVLPKTFRKTTATNYQKESEQNKVYICVTEEETSLEAKYEQMEMELRAAKEERDMFQQDITKLKGELQETQKELKKAHTKLDRFNTVSKAKKVENSLIMEYLTILCV